MELLCVENTRECYAYPDPALLNDSRVLDNLLRCEEQYLLPQNYLEKGVGGSSITVTEVRPDMRNTVAEWMFEVCEEQKCQDEVFPLSTNILDRFLATCPVLRRRLQLLGATCLLIASKLRESRPLSARLLALYTDNTVTESDIWSWELLVLSKLKWDVAAITPQDFVRHLLRRIHLGPDWDEVMVRRHTHTLIALCAREYKFCSCPPSMVAAASIAAALHGLDWSSRTGFSLGYLLDLLHHATQTERDYLQSCLEQIEQMVASALRVTPVASTSTETSISNDPTNSTTTNSPNNTPGTESSAFLSSVTVDVSHDSGGGCGIVPISADKLDKAGTPTDVRDIHF